MPPTKMRAVGLFAFKGVPRWRRSWTRRRKSWPVRKWLGRSKGGKMRGHKSGGFAGNLSKIGGSGSKLKMKSDMKADSMVHPSLKKGKKQAHKKA